MENQEKHSVKDLIVKLSPKEFNELYSWANNFSNFIKFKLKIRKLPSGYEPEDIVQEIFTKILNDSLFYNPEKTTNLKKILSRKIKNYFVYLSRLKECKKNVDIELFNEDLSKYQVDKFKNIAYSAKNTEQLNENLILLKKKIRNKTDKNILELLVNEKPKKQIIKELGINEARVNSAITRFKAILYRESNKNLIELD